MINNFNRNRILWLLIALMAFSASLTGAANQGIYRNLIINDNLPGVLSQDLVTVLTSIGMLFLIIRTGKGDIIKQLILLGIIGYMFYAYGIYVLAKVYNMLYFLYMAIFSLSFFSLVSGITNIGNKAYDKI